jgi:Fur family transcriptional regulator, iron response regulator
MHSSLVFRLRDHGVQPTAQRVAVAEYALQTDEHPSAEQVYARVRERFPMLSRATVYNTLNLLVEKGLLKQLTLAEGRVVFDPNMERHHHFIDEATGTIHDVPWPMVRVSKLEELADFEVREYQVVMRGKRRAGRRPRK